MTLKSEVRTITVPAEIYVCDKCGVEALKGLPGTGIGWLCCHEVDQDVLGRLTVAGEWHLCPTCKPLIAEFVRTAPPLEPAKLTLALERIARETVLGSTSSPHVINAIALAALKGKEAPADIPPTTAMNLSALLSRAISSGKMQIIPLGTEPAGPETTTAPTTSPAPTETP